MSENIKKLTNSIGINLPFILTLLFSSFVIAISSQISIPFPNGVPMTLQTFSIALVSFCLYKNNKGIKSIIAYLFLGLIGIPVFAQGKSGFTSLIGLTGGFLYGFIFLSYFCQKSKTCKSVYSKVFFAIFGLLLCHLFGILQYSILTNISFINSALLVSVPFLFKDILSVLLAFMLSSNVNYLGKKLKYFFVKN